MPCPRRSTGTLFSTALALFAASSALAEPTEPAAADGGGASAMVDVVYDLYIGGIHLARADGRIGVTGDLYGLRLDAGLVGLTGRLVNWSAMIEGNGRLAERQVEPRRFVMENQIRRDFRTIRMSFGDGALTELEMLPELSDDVERVPDDLLSGIYDPLGALVAVMAQITAEGQCTLSMPVFDGRRLYQLQVRDRGHERLAPNRYSAYAGWAHRCGVTFEPIAGDFDQRTRDLVNRLDRPPEQREILVWIAQTLPDGPFLPIRAEAESSRHGSAVVHIHHSAASDEAAEERADLFGLAATDGAAPGAGTVGDRD